MSLRYAILGTLAVEPASGYDLVRRFDAKLNFVWWASHGAVYTELAKLQSEGLIVQSEGGGRNRVLNSVTPSGMAALRDWLGSEPSRRPRDELMLRVFSQWVNEGDAAAAFFESLADSYRRRLGEYESRAQQRPSLGDLDGAALYDGIALNAGIAHERAMLSWAEQSAQLVRAHHRSDRSARQSTEL